jgi:hypothetical protein
MKNYSSLKGLTYVAMAFVMFFASCSDNNKIDFTSNDASNVEGETTADSFSSDAADVSTDAIAGVDATDLSGGRESTIKDKIITGDYFKANDRLKCATITLTTTGTQGAPAGVITIVYPDNGTCKDARGNVRKGTITITYTGKRFELNSKIVTTFNNYTINGVKIEGAYTITNVTPTNTSFPRFTAVIDAGKITFLNGKTITRTQNFTREWQRANNPLQDKWVLIKGSTAAGTNRNGTAYTMTVTTDLVHSRACELSDKVFIAVSGEKQFIADNKTITINYGDGACDNNVTITINGKSKDVTIAGDGN